jgi:hypothetical protein
MRNRGTGSRAIKWKETFLRQMIKGFDVLGVLLPLIDDMVVAGDGVNKLPERRKRKGILGYSMLSASTGWQGAICGLPCFCGVVGLRGQRKEILDSPQTRQRELRTDGMQSIVAVEETGNKYAWPSAAENEICEICNKRMQSDAVGRIMASSCR